MNAPLRVLIRIGLPLAIIAGGVFAQKALVSMKEPAAAKPPGDEGILVRTQRVESTRQMAHVAAQGTVLPAREVSLQPEVQGRVVYRSPALVVGGTFKKGELLLRVDPTEYQLRAQQSATQVDQAVEQLKLEQSRSEVAAREWQLIGGEANTSVNGREVALRQPQMREAEARIALAQQSKDLAQLNVGRTVLRAPFNGIVKSGQVNVGQFVSPALSLGTLVGSDEYWVQVSVPMDQLEDIQVPGLNAQAGKGARATVWQQLGEKRVERDGEVMRLYGDVDPMGRLSRVLVSIKDPLSLDKIEAERGLPLLLGAYVHVDIEGHEMKEVLEVPRSAVHAGRYIYVYGPDDRLIVREVQIAWRKPKSFLLKSGLSSGEEIIVSRLGAAVEGLKLRRVEGTELEVEHSATPEKSTEASTAPGQLTENEGRKSAGAASRSAPVIDGGDRE